MKAILMCSGRYTMKEVCPDGSRALTSKPPKYSPEDKYARYRRQAKLDEYSKKGLI